MLRKKLNQWISGRKGYDYRIDENIPAAYLFGLVLGRYGMMVTDFGSGIRNEGSFFLSAKAIIKARSKMRVGHSVTIERAVYIDALSTDGIVLGNNVSVGRNTKIEGTGNLRFFGKRVVGGQ